jgi:glycosyltransferase involved in cell wall biosynthesis
MGKIKIAVNTRLLLRNKMEGIGWFAYETLSRITRGNPDVEFVFIFDRKWDDEFIFANNITPVIASPQARHPLLWYLYFDWGVPHVLRKHKPDLFLSPDGWLSLRTSVPQLPVIHDLNFVHHPEFLPAINRKYYDYFFPRFAKKAARIATVSEFSKGDIAENYGIDKSKIDVVYNGCNTLYKPLTDDAIQATRNQFSQGAPYFLFVGLIHPRKNLVNLFLAFDEFKSATGHNAKLLLVGEKKWWTDDIRQSYEGLTFKDDVVFVGRVSNEVLQQLLGAALCLTYVPFFEGFGIPILEGMNADVPVITSNITSMPEVGGNAVLLADPFNPSSIKQQMERIALDSDLRTSLIEKGRIRRLDFSWDKTAELLWKSIEKTL